jgi:hypothetical protein
VITEAQGANPTWKCRRRLLGLIVKYKNEFRATETGTAGPIATASPTRISFGGGGGSGRDH